MNGFLALKISDPAMYSLAFALFVVILIGLVLIRRKTWKEKGFQNPDIVLALIPVVFALLITGKIQKFAFAGLEFETVFKEASKSGIEDQITPFETSKPEIIEMEMAAKGGIDRIPELVNQKTEALVFQLGHGGYWGPAIGEYLDGLVQYPFLKLIIIEDKQGKLFGVFDAREMAASIRSPALPFELEAFAVWLNKSNVGELERLPGFISAEAALTEEANKRAALERLDSLNVNQLPVIGKDGRFLGVVDRSRVTASLILEVARKIE